MSKHPKPGGDKPSTQPHHVPAEQIERGASGTIQARGEIEPKTPPDILKKREIAEQKKETRDRRRFWVEVLGLGFVVIYAGLTGIQALLTRESLQTAKMQFQQDERPYLWLTDDLGPFVISPQSSGNTSGRLAFNFHFKNYGKSPAVNSHSEGRIVFGEKVGDNVSFPPFDTKSGTIVPPGKDVFNTAWSDEPISTEMFTRIQTPGVIEHVRVFGRIQYSDTAGNLYSSDFCLERNPSLGLAFCKEDNSIK